MNWRERGYIWGNERLIHATEPIDLINLPRFDHPRAFRVDVRLPPNPSAVAFSARIFAMVGQGDGSAAERELFYNFATGKGSAVVYGSSLRVFARYNAGPILSTSKVAAWATPSEDGGIQAARPKPFGTSPATASVAQGIVSVTLAAAGERRRVSIANRPAAGTELLLLAYGRAAAAGDFDVIVQPNTTLIEEGWDGQINGIWSAAGAGFARVAVFVD